MGRLGLGIAIVAAVAAATADPADARGRSVPDVLDAMVADGRLPAAEHRAHRREWRAARRAVRRLDGAERANLDGVVDHARDLARRGMLASRIAPVFRTLRVNREWFWTDRLGAPPAGSRRSFAGSRVIFQFRPGSGWQIHPLATAGRLNALARTRARPRRLASWANDLLGVAVERRGFLALEYLFPYREGRPGWISGMATATAMSALARVWRRTGDERFRQAGERMLGAFATPPPWGVRLERGDDRAHFLLYSQAPGLLVGNGFAQALIGLHEYATITGSSGAASVLEAGVRQADRRMRFYDTGDWSLYWRQPGRRRGAESSLHYHRLFGDFLLELCRRFPSHEFCALHERFERYEAEPVRIGRPRARRRGKRLRIRVWASKPGTATLRLTRGSRVHRSAEHFLRRGTHTVTWRAPRRGTYRLRIAARSLTGVTSERSRRIRIR